MPGTVLSTPWHDISCEVNELKAVFPLVGEPDLVGFMTSLAVLPRSYSQPGKERLVKPGESLAKQKKEVEFYFSNDGKLWWF